jgi:hypothetical protein
MGRIPATGEQLIGWQVALDIIDLLINIREPAFGGLSF